MRWLCPLLPSPPPLYSLRPSPLPPDLPQTKEFFEKNSFERVTDSPAEFAKLVERDSLHWKALIDQVGAKAD